MAVEHHAHAKVVLVRSEIGMGTGFMVNGAGADLTIVTNHHVVAGGHRFEIELPSTGGAPVVLGRVEVLKVDREADLAVLRAGRPDGAAAGLELSPGPVQLGQPLAVLGYPYVRGSQPTMTVERGDVTATERIFAAQPYIQTNANVNPGNSGGPVLDGCGRVIGVVVAKVTTTERTNLIIPIARVLPLLQAASTPEGDPRAVATAQIDRFLSALSYGEADAAAAYVSRAYLDQKIAPLVKKAMNDGSAKVAETRASLARRGIDLDKLPAEKVKAILLAVMSPEELLCVGLGVLIDNGRIDGEQAVRAYFAQAVPALFGRVSAHRIDRVKIEAGVARAVVNLDTKDGSQVWVLDLVREWGDWQIAGFSRG
jgi:hypothetical protein